METRKALLLPRVRDVDAVMSESGKNVWSVVGLIVTSVIGLAVFMANTTVQTLSDWREAESAQVAVEIDLRAKSLQVEKAALEQRERLLRAVVAQRKALDDRNAALDTMLPALIERMEIIRERDIIEDAVRIWMLRVMRRFAVSSDMDVPSLPPDVAESLGLNPGDAND